MVISLVFCIARGYIRLYHVISRGKKRSLGFINVYIFMGYKPLTKWHIQVWSFSLDEFRRNLQELGWKIPWLSPMFKSSGDRSVTDFYLIFIDEFSQLLSYHWKHQALTPRWERRLRKSWDPQQNATTDKGLPACGSTENGCVMVCVCVKRGYPSGNFT